MTDKKSPEQTKPSVPIRTLLQSIHNKVIGKVASFRGSTRKVFN